MSAESLLKNETQATTAGRPRTAVQSRCRHQANRTGPRAKSAAHTDRPSLEGNGQIRPQSDGHAKSRDCRTRQNNFGAISGDHAGTGIRQTGGHLARAELPRQEFRDERKSQDPRDECGKREISRDLEKAVEFDQSRLFKSIYEDEFGTPGGEPIGAIIGDYEFDNSFDDVQTLQGVSAIAAAAFAPFISAASPRMFGFEDYRDLARPRDLEKIFDTVEYAKWRSFRGKRRFPLRDARSAPRAGAHALWPKDQPG